MTDDTENKFAIGSALLRKAFMGMRELEGELSELISHALGTDDEDTGPLITAPILAQLIMECLPQEEDGPVSTFDKQFWIEVADYLGPDWLPKLKSMVDLGHKVEGWTI